MLTENVIGCSTVMMNRSILEKHLFPSDKLNIVTVARFGKEKGVLRAIRAVSKLEKKIFSNIILSVTARGLNRQKLLLTS